MDEHLSLDEQESLRERAREATLAANQLRDDLRNMMATQFGRRLMWGILADAGIYRSSFSESGKAMAYREGQRSLGLKYLTLLSLHCPEQYDQMTRENRITTTGNLET